MPDAPIDHLAEAERLEREAEALRSRLSMIEDAARLHRTIAGVVVESRLTIDHEPATVEPQMHAESAGAGKSKGQIDPAHLDHKFVAMLVRRGLTVKDIGDHLEKKLKRKFPNQTIQAWYRDADDVYYRPMPEDVSIVLKDDFAVPLSAWPRIRKPKSKRA